MAYILWTCCASILDSQPGFGGKLIGAAMAVSVDIPSRRYGRNDCSQEILSRFFSSKDMEAVAGVRLVDIQFQTSDVDLSPVSCPRCAIAMQAYHL